MQKNHQSWKIYIEIVIDITANYIEEIHVFWCLSDWIYHASSPCLLELLRFQSCRR